ncbi:MAG: efflux RND transporter periplasmic adaptor subunit [Ardenticatenales bacterium]|nr:efflux RND transporter periplasmic adaptor subunit [Ardenticatenales bacterium]
MTQPPRRSGLPWLPIALILLLLLIAVVAWSLFMAGAADEVQSATVDAITLVTTVEASGVVAPRQQATLTWRTTGQVEEIQVEVGERVEKGQPLMGLDPATVPATVGGAQAELLAAQEVLNNLLAPDMMTLATSQRAVVEGYNTLDQATRALEAAIDRTQPIVSASLYQSVTDSRSALVEARTVLPLVGSPLDVQLLYRASRLTERDFERYEEFATLSEESDQESTRTSGAAVRDSYEAVLATQQALEEELDQDTVDEVEELSKAQSAYEEAVADLGEALVESNSYTLTLELAQSQAQMAIAEATLFNALTELDHRLNGPAATDLAAAEARLQAAQTTVDSLTLTAPFAGEIVALYNQVGDMVTQNPALIVADLTRLHITTLVDETEVAQIALGAPASITFSARPELLLEGSVLEVSRIGQLAQGLVKHEVKILLDNTSEVIPLGTTADVSIKVSVQEGVLAVPLDALQSDAQGEFVNRLGSDDTLERVAVESGELQGDLVVVRGNLQARDRVQIVAPEPRSGGFGQ